MDDASEPLDERDVIILQEIARNPQITTRELADRLTDQHGIDISHVTVSESIRRMRRQGVFREAILLNETYFWFALFEFSLNPEAFAEEYEDAMEHVRDSPNTLFYFRSDGEYQWKAVMMFPDEESHSMWIHEFYKEYGHVVKQIKNSVSHNILKFGTDPDLLASLIKTNHYQ